MPKKGCSYKKKVYHKGEIWSPCFRFSEGFWYHGVRVCISENMLKLLFTGAPEAPQDDESSAIEISEGAPFHGWGEREQQYHQQQKQLQQQIQQDLKPKL